MPGSGPGGADGGDEELWWEGFAPEEFGDGGNELSGGWRGVVDGHFGCRLTEFFGFKFHLWDGGGSGGGSEGDGCEGE